MSLDTAVMANTEMAGLADGGEARDHGVAQWAGLEVQGGGDPPLFQTPPCRTKHLQIWHHRALAERSCSWRTSTQ
eukprot:6033253-Pleurochrysis_carterae.AAC.1